MRVYLFPTELEAHKFKAASPECEVAICGVGMAASGAFAAKYITENRDVDHIILCGIAGKNIKSPLRTLDVVEVISETIEELPNRFRTEYATTPLFDIQQVRSNTVSSTNNRTIASDIENMEGAAVAAVCETFGVQFNEIRSISNNIGAHPADWKIEDATEALATKLTELIK